MASHGPNDRLRSLLGEADWSAGELARAVNGLGTAQSMTLRYDRTSVAHWLSGSKPRPAVAELVAAAFSRRIGRLVTVGETGLAPEVPAVGARFVDGIREAPLLQRLVDLARSDADPTERAHLVQSAYRLVPVPTQDWEQTSALQPAPFDEKRRATAEDAQMLNVMTKAFADQMDRHGGGHARATLAAYLANDVTRILIAAAPPLLHRELVTATSQLTHLLARMTSDAGHQGLAQIYFETALELARVAENRAAYAVTLRAMSAQAMQLGHHRNALALADAALEAAGPRVNGATRAFLLSQQAVTCAHDGQRRAAITSLSAAEAQLERASSTPGPFTSYPRAGLEYQRAQTLLALGLRADALAALRDSARLRTPDRRRASALTEFRVAEVLLAMGNLEEACTHLNQFLDQWPLLRSAQIDQAVAKLRGSLRPYLRQRQALAVWERARSLADDLPRRY
ncbi:tetratricopeptide (TPR) repeat protein [Streptomyces sp. V4I8]